MGIEAEVVRDSDIGAIYGCVMMSSAWSLAEISAAILSYNEPLAPDSPKPNLKGDGTLNRKPPIATPCGRMRRHGDRKGGSLPASKFF